MISNISDTELEHVAQQAMQHKEVLSYLKRVLHADNPQQYLLYDNPIHLTKVGNSIQAFRVRLSGDLGKIILDSVDPRFPDNVIPNIYTAPINKMLDNGQKVAVGLVEADQSKQAKVTNKTSKASEEAVQTSTTTTKKVTHRGRPKKSTK